MTDTDPLARSYRRLLRSYPGWHRRERGLEMLTTLLDAAEPGQRRASRHDAADIVLNGLRCRLRLPRGIGFRVAATLAALAASATLAAAVGLLAIASTPMPSEAEAEATARIVSDLSVRNLPGPVISCPSACSPDWDDNGDQVATFDDQVDRNLDTTAATGVSLEDHVTVAYQLEGIRPADFADSARTRLAAHGWNLGPTDHTGSSHRFQATNGRVNLSVIADDGAAYLIFSREMPGWVTPFVLIMLPIGLLVGWACVNTIARRARQRHPVVRAAVIGVAFAGLLAAALIEALMALMGVTTAVLAETPASIALTPAVVLAMLTASMPVFPLVAGASALIVTGLAALPTPPVRAQPDTIINA
jgi:hypothetical protein